jgi:hypothetical protein
MNGISSRHPRGVIVICSRKHRSGSIRARRIPASPPAVTAIVAFARQMKNAASSASFQSQWLRVSCKWVGLDLKDDEEQAR